MKVLRITPQEHATVIAVQVPTLDQPMAAFLEVLDWVDPSRKLAWLGVSTTSRIAIVLNRELQAELDDFGGFVYADPGQWLLRYPLTRSVRVLPIEGKFFVRDECPPDIEWTPA